MVPSTQVYLVPGTTGPCTWALGPGPFGPGRPLGPEGPSVGSFIFNSSGKWCNTLGSNNVDNISRTNISFINIDINISYTSN